MELSKDNFNNIKIAGRKRIKDRGINWKETYHKRTQKLKDRFDSDIGPWAYVRWEGHDYTTNSDYFVVVSPSLTKDLEKRFFAGVKKLPEDPEAKVYAPYGEYFTSSVLAFSYASEKWGIPFPKEAPKYTVKDLEGVKIPRHIKGSYNLNIKKSQNENINLNNVTNDNVVSDDANNVNNINNVNNDNNVVDEDEILRNVLNAITPYMEMVNNSYDILKMKQSLNALKNTINFIEEKIKFM